MKVTRIISNIAADSAAVAICFYHHMLGLGWIVTYGAQQQMTVQLSFASESCSGTPVPGFSIEVNDLDAALMAVKAADFPAEYGRVDEPWSVRRFYVRDPFGVNILAHIGIAT